MDNESSIPSETGYTVVARRYRPKSFAELIGQNHIAQALGKAISTGRVGHAYLFTGARGVGKTSTARIFAKVLNTTDCEDEAVALDISAAIDTGDDMDVIEIDGASNRGIEEIRQLRANVNVRPSRSRYKIYIIDEVHMLTNQAFNALLKTLEEPPTHVKFIFCTTDPDKIPITVLSRCQRYDFAPVAYEEIRKRLKEICECEGFTADEEALGLLARRAAGSMRDSQSLLEQVMSFSAEHITLEQVHALLGTADEGQLLALVEQLSEANALGAMELVDQSIRGGTDPGQLAEQLLNLLRDMMMVSLKGTAETLKLASPASYEKLQQLGEKLGTQAILSAIQIVDESLVRMRSSVSAVTLLEVALVQICHLEHLASIPELLERVSRIPAAAGRGAGEKKKLNNASGQSEQDSTGDGQAGVPVVGRRDEPSPISQATNGRAGGTSSAGEVDGRQSSTTPSNVDSGDVKAEVLESSPTDTASSNSQASALVAPASTAPASTAPASTAPASTAPTSPAAAPGSHGDSHAGSQSVDGKAAGLANGSGRIASSAASAAPAVDGGRAVVAGSSEALENWGAAVKSIDGMLADFAGMAVQVEPLDGSRWKVYFPPGATRPCEYCEVSQRKDMLQAALKQRLGRQIQLNFAVMPGKPPSPVAKVAQSSLRAMKLREMSEDPYVKKVCEILDGEIVRVDPPRIAPPPANSREQVAAG